MLCLGSSREPPVASHARRRAFFPLPYSLNWYVPDILAQLASVYGIQGHKQVGLQSLGTSRTIQHWELNGGRNRARQALEKGDVDVFTMSPIQFPEPGIEHFVKLGLEHNPKMRFTVQISWSGNDRDNQKFSIASMMSASMADREKTAEQLKTLNLDNVKAARAQAEKINKEVGSSRLHRPCISCSATEGFAGTCTLLERRKNPSVLGTSADRLACGGHPLLRASGMAGAKIPKSVGFS